MKPICVKCIKTTWRGRHKIFKINYIRMKPLLIFLITSGIIVSCSGKGSGGRKEGASGDLITAARDYSSTYFARKLGNARIFTDEEDGLVTITNDISGYKINHGKIVTGLIDDDEAEDGIVPFYAMQGKSIMGYYHMILLASADTFRVAKTVSGIFTVHDIRDRKIIAEVSTVSPDSPGYGCDNCREVISYLWNNGNLEKEE